MTEVVQSSKYYKSHAVGVTSNAGLTTDRDLAEPSRTLKKYDALLYLCNTGSYMVWAAIQQH